MQIAEAAARLGVPAHHVTALREHAGGHVATLRGGQLMLVSATVCRPYVPAVDDVPLAPLPDESEPAEPKAKRPVAKRGASGGRSA